MAKRSSDEPEHDILDIIPERFDNEGDEPHREKGGHRLRNTLAMLLAVVGVSALVAAIWHFAQGSGPGPGGIPVIRASNGPFKERPENRGGMQIPNQNKLVYRRLEGLPGPDTKNDHLLPGPEQPVAPPAGPAQAPPPAPTETLYPGASQTASAPPVAPAPPAVSMAKPQPAPQTLPAVPRPVAPQPAATAHVAPAPHRTAEVHKSPEVHETKMRTVAHPVKRVEHRARHHVATRHHSTAPARVEHGAYSVQLAAMRSRAAAEVEWRHQLRVNGALLRGLRPSFVEVHLGRRGTFWRLRAGSMSERAARELCRRLEQRRQGCLIARK